MAVGILPVSLTLLREALKLPAEAEIVGLEPSRMRPWEARLAIHHPAVPPAAEGAPWPELEAVYRTHEDGRVTLERVGPTGRPAWP